MIFYFNLECYKTKFRLYNKLKIFKCLFSLNLMVHINHNIPILLYFPKYGFHCPHVHPTASLQTHNKSTPRMVIFIGKGIQCLITKIDAKESPSISPKAPEFNRLWWGKWALICLISPLLDLKGSHGSVKFQCFFFLGFFLENFMIFMLWFERKKNHWFESEKLL